MARRLANATRSGLARAFWTHDLGRSHRVAVALRAGTVWINGNRSIHVGMPAVWLWRPIVRLPAVFLAGAVCRVPACVMARAILMATLLILAACQPQPVPDARAAGWRAAEAHDRVAPPAPALEIPAAPESGGGY